MFEFVDTDAEQVTIKVIGIGGGGCNAIEYMQSSGIEGVNYICVDTDAQALENLTVSNILQIGENGLGTEGNPEVGREAALKDRDPIMGVLEGADMVFIIAGLGGGTGSGAAPIVAQVAKEMGILTLALVTQPFAIEEEGRLQIANDCINQLNQYVDSLLTVSTEKILAGLDPEIGMVGTFIAVNDFLHVAVRGIAELITCPGLINVDFTDVKTVMSETERVMVGIGEAQGVDRANVAAETAVSSQLMEDINLPSVQGILVNITAGMDMTIGEFDEVGNTVKRLVNSDNATVVVGTVIDPDMSGEMRVTIVLVGYGQPGARNDSSILSNSIPAPSKRFLKKDSEYLDIPVSSAAKKSGGKSDYEIIDNIRVITSEKTDDIDVVNLIEHLSYVYKSIGGDEFIIQDIKNVPPDKQDKEIPAADKDKSATG